MLGDVVKCSVSKNHAQVGMTMICRSVPIIICRKYPMKQCECKHSQEGMYNGNMYKVM